MKKHLLCHTWRLWLHVLQVLMVFSPNPSSQQNQLEIAITWSLLSEECDRCDPGWVALQSPSIARVLPALEPPVPGKHQHQYPRKPGRQAACRAFIGLPFPFYCLAKPSCLLSPCEQRVSDAGACQQKYTSVHFFLSVGNAVLSALFSLSFWSCTRRQTLVINCLGRFLAAVSCWSHSIKNRS